MKLRWLVVTGVLLASAAFWASGIPARYGYGQAASIRAKTNPSVTDLVKRRIRSAIEGDPDAFTNAIVMAHDFESWVPASFPPTIELIAKRASERVLAEKPAVTHAASRFRGIDCALADGSARRRSDPAPIRALVERRGAVPVTALTFGHDCANTLFRHRHVPESRALLEKRFVPENVPKDVDYAVLAEFTVATRRRAY